MSYGINEATGRRKDNTKVNSDGYAVLHTQEVTGSSPVVSTKKFLISQEIRNFSFYFFEICILVIVLVRSDQYDDQYGNSIR